MYFKAIICSNNMSNGSLIYRSDEYSFSVIPVPEGGFTSVLFNDLNLELNDTGRIISVWGICPHNTWKEASLAVPDGTPAEVIFVPDVPLVRGVSIRLGDRKNLPVLFDRSSGWIHIAGSGRPSRSFKLLAGVILELDETDNLLGIWLRPAEFPKLD